MSTDPLPRARQPLPEHPVRIALLDLLAEVGTVTSTEAAARLGHSSGLCSFHLRQLARHGLIEEAPHSGGRARPWQLCWAPADQPVAPVAPAAPVASTAPTALTSSVGSGQETPEEFAVLARDLEDQSYHHWLAHREQAPVEWRQDESFSVVLHLTPAETADLAASIRRLLADYREREQRPGARPAGAVAVAAVARLFPLLAELPGRQLAD